MIFRWVKHTNSLKMIKVIKDIDTNTRQVYYFNIFNLCVVFVKYEKQTKPAGKRKWNVIEKWDVYNSITGETARLANLN